jgi:N6-adenosine-specific RNA methylase IME4
MNELVKWEQIAKEIDIARDIKTLQSIDIELERWKKYCIQNKESTITLNKINKYRMQLHAKIGDEYRKLDNTRGGDRKSENFQTSTDLTTDKQSAQELIGKSREAINKWAKINNQLDLIDEFENDCNKQDTEMTESGFVKFRKEKEPPRPVTIPILPEGKYNVIYADPPWPVESMILNKWESPLDYKYKTMTLEEIKNLKVQDLAHEDCALFLWTTHTFLHDAFHIMDAWGFKYHAAVTWDKGGGWTLCGIHRRTEFCLYGYKGKMNIEQEGEALSTLFYEAKGKHSSKPIFMRKEIERKIKGKRIIELFAREKFDGWDSWGNQL